MSSQREPQKEMSQLQEKKSSHVNFGAGNKPSKSLALTKYPRLAVPVLAIGQAPLRPLAG